MTRKVQFLQSPRGSWSRSGAVVMRSDGGIFWWAVAITLLLGFAVFSWLFCIYVCSHPERPFSYSLLNRFEKLEPLKPFSDKDAPGGKNMTCRDVHQTFFSFTEENLKQKNAELHRAYITNYSGKELRPVYLRGQFKVLHSRPLTSSDVFTCGTIARCVALIDGDKEYRPVIVEYVIPTRTPPKDQLMPGDIISLDTGDMRNKRRRFASLLNVARHGEDGLILTTVPLAYGEHGNASAGLSIASEPPARLNLEGAWPITSDSIGAPVTSVAVVK
jgi:hypothetical protein